MPTRLFNRGAFEASAQKLPAKGVIISFHSDFVVASWAKKLSTIHYRTCHKAQAKRKNVRFCDEKRSTCREIGYNSSALAD